MTMKLPDFSKSIPTILPNVTQQIDDKKASWTGKTQAASSNIFPGSESSTITKVKGEHLPRSGGLAKFTKKLGDFANKIISKIKNPPTKTVKKGSENITVKTDLAAAKLQEIKELKGPVTPAVKQALNGLTQQLQRLQKENAPAEECIALIDRVIAGDREAISEGMQIGLKEELLQDPATLKLMLDQSKLQLQKLMTSKFANPQTIEQAKKKLENEIKDLEQKLSKFL